MKTPEYMTSNPEVDEQNENLRRVCDSLSTIIMEYYRLKVTNKDLGFSGRKLELHAMKYWSATPGSATRILRKLRNEGKLDYEVVNRSQSLYRFKVKGEQLSLLKG